MRGTKSYLGLVLGVCVVITAILYTGYVKSYLDEGVQTTFFFKQYPTLQMEFHDPFASEGDDVPIDQLRRADRAAFADYCKYRFGVVGNSTQSLDKCKKGIPAYL
ncbi:hypothetical protein AWB75_02989 [Caballeronia catudaia]|uniref:Uncharacterized protein n=1 Tax=Caballeronia catudaia TaxID=1777136 RepID=A0A158B6D0_9BURK|nr:hypothetical protein [Caballeronia catudaia]SAK64927.1 hypothetical protein AWB75_02989 [Caballeronia catudaia]